MRDDLVINEGNWDIAIMKELVGRGGGRGMFGRGFERELKEIYLKTI